MSPSAFVRAMCLLDPVSRTGAVVPAGRGVPLRRRPMRAFALLALSAALSAGPARALDFEKADALPTLERCPAKGPGFVRMPGSRTCTRLSGRATVGADLRTGQGGTTAGSGATGRIAIDTRTDSDLGEVRTYVRIGNGRR